MSRSGTHAIINWLLAQVRGRYCFLNCAEPGTNPYRTARLMHTGRAWDANIPDFDPACEGRSGFKGKDFLIHSYEDCFLGKACGREFERHHDEWLGASAARTDVLILRDPFNLFASRKRAGMYRGHPDADQNIVPWHTAARIWRQHARAFVRECNHFNQRLVVVSYNRWVEERAYRRELARALGLSFSDAGMRNVAGVAGGSSFDGTFYHTTPEKMNVHERWRHFEHDADFWRLFDVDGLMALSERIFGPPPVAGARNQPARSGRPPRPRPERRFA